MTSSPRPILSIDGAVKRFQARHGLPPDGVIGDFTLKAMNIPANVRLQQLNTNLVRLQTFPSDLGRRHVMVNIPATRVEAVQDGQVALRHEAIVGRESRPTHIINSKIYEVILNPYWTAPRSIIIKDIMPLMRKDPTYLARSNIRLLDGKGQEVAPETIDWNSDKAPDLMFRQDPGKTNAMASTKINFHNPNNEYMHDTPEQGLFNKLMRFDSSGCVRVQNVRDLATWLLSETPGWPRQHIEQVISTRVNTPITLAAEVPVYFVYISAWSARDGTVAGARAGLLDGIRHTSNGDGYLDFTGYHGKALYRDTPAAVTDGRVVTAGGTSPVSFMAAVMDGLGLADENLDFYVGMHAAQFAKAA